MRRFSTYVLIATSTIAPAFAAGDYNRGKERALSWHCIGCHGLTGNDRSSSETSDAYISVPMLAGQPESYLIRTLKQYKSRERVDDHEMSMMSERAGWLTDQDIEDISAYFSAQKRY